MKKIKSGFLGLCLLSITLMSIYMTPSSPGIPHLHYQIFDAVNDQSVIDSILPVTIYSTTPLNNLQLTQSIGGAPMWACFGMGLIFGAAVASGNGFAAVGSFIYIANNCI